MFSQLARKHLITEIKHIYNTLYIIYTHFPTVSAIFANVLTTRLWEREFMTFEFYGLSPSRLEMLL